MWETQNDFIEDTQRTANVMTKNNENHKLYRINKRLHFIDVKYYENVNIAVSAEHFRCKQLRDSRLPRIWLLFTIWLFFPCSLWNCLNSIAFKMKILQVFCTWLDAFRVLFKIKVMLNPQIHWLCNTNYTWTRNTCITNIATINVCLMFIFNASTCFV